MLILILLIIIIEGSTIIIIRKNAGTLLRLISDDFNTRKFPELVAPFRTRSLSLPSSLGAPELERGGGGGGGRRWRVATDMFVFLRRLGHNTFGSNPHPLPDREERSREGEGDAPDQS